MPKVSIVMSVYNGENNVNRAIKSILTQSFKDFEFIIINDGSTDSTSEKLNKFKDERIIIYDNRTNLGLAKSLNIGIKKASGKYIARMDADDVSMKNRLETQASFLEKNSDIAMVGSNAIGFDGKSNFLGKSKLPLKSDCIRKRLIINNCFFHSSVMVRRKVIYDIGFYNKNMKYAQDYDLWLRMVAKYKLVNISEPLIKHLEYSSLDYNNLKKRKIATKYSLIAKHRAIRTGVYPLFYYYTFAVGILSIIIPVKLKLAYYNLFGKTNLFYKFQRVR